MFSSVHNITSDTYDAWIKRRMKNLLALSRGQVCTSHKSSEALNSILDGQQFNNPQTSPTVTIVHLNYTFCLIKSIAVRERCFGKETVSTLVNLFRKTTAFQLSPPRKKVHCPFQLLIIQDLNSISILWTTSTLCNETANESMHFFHQRILWIFQIVFFATSNKNDRGKSQFSILLANLNLALTPNPQYYYMYTSNEHLVSMLSYRWAQYFPLFWVFCRCWKAHFMTNTVG